MLHIGRIKTAVIRAVSINSSQIDVWKMVKGSY